MNKYLNYLEIDLCDLWYDLDNGLIELPCSERRLVMDAFFASRDEVLICAAVELAQQYTDFETTKKILELSRRSGNSGTLDTFIIDELGRRASQIELKDFAPFFSPEKSSQVQIFASRVIFFEDVVPGVEGRMLVERWVASVENDLVKVFLHGYLWTCFGSQDAFDKVLSARNSSSLDEARAARKVFSNFDVTN